MLMGFAQNFEGGNYEIYQKNKKGICFYPFHAFFLCRVMGKL
jgi:hypothetical protein